MRLQGKSRKLLAPLLATVLLLGSVMATVCRAEDARLRYKKIQGQIRQQEKNIRETRHKESSISAELNAINGQLARYQQQLRAQKRQLENTNARIARTNTGITQTKQELKDHQQWLENKLIGFQKNGKAEDIVMLLGADDMGSFLRRWRYLEILAKLEKDQLDQYKSVYAQLQQKEAKLQGLYSGLRRQQAATLAIQGKLNGKWQEKNNLLASIRSQRASYEAALEQLREASRKLFEMISRSGRDSTYRGKGFRAARSRLPWPVSGIVVFGYGRGTDPVFGTPVFRNGIYIKTAAGATVRSVFSGKVVFANWFKGYGQLVIINHGGGYNSLYAGLNEIFLKVGDIIMGRAPLGRAGGSVMVNGPSLYFEVRYRGKPLDPMQWLARN